MQNMSIPHRKIKPKSSYTDDFMGKPRESSRIFHRKMLRFLSKPPIIVAVHSNCMAVMHVAGIARDASGVRGGVAALFPLH